MFRKIAIALVAASVLTAPVLAQGTTPGDSKVSPTTPAPTASTPEKSEKAVTKVTKHRVVARHHRHGTKMAKYTKSHGTKMVKHTRSHGTKMVKYAKGARASAKPISSKPGTKPSSSKPAAKSSLH
jgi:hypothetical protein